ncbi:hypothetical protein [Urechidicola vernalis]|uniref:Uncharacterized protein n=1 Tax=Urechidicola vernalis TaxID=3075600 RepID=A0ABU2Y545_9FLAO|nr:hypothetical protein [Urechidicola sp. P050]MDT0553167.1 hypothetical protein [Urechidicola sp. P050]
MPREEKSLQFLDKIKTDNLYPKLLEQLNKDFRFSGIPDEIESTVKANELQNRLITIIYNLINRNFADYLNLLYRIDISESEIKKLDGSDIEKLSVQVSKQILKRECQKVWLRNRL